MNYANIPPDRLTVGDQNLSAKVGQADQVIPGGGPDHTFSLGAAAAAVQLPQADVVHHTRPGLFDELPRELLTDAHRTLEAWPHAGDRMMLAPLLPVSLQAQRVAFALLWHGWSSIPSRDRLCDFTQIANVSNISKAIKELEVSGIMSRRQRTDSGRGYTGNRYTFRGLVVCQYLVRCCHPPLAAAAQAILDYHAVVNEAETSRGVRETPRATDVPVEAETSRGVRETPRATDVPVEAETSRGVRETPRATDVPVEAETSRGVRETPRATDVPVEAETSRGVRETPRATDVPVEAETSRGVRETPRATDVPVETETSRGVRGTSRDSPGGRDFIARSVRHTPPGVYVVHHNHDDDLIDKKKNLLNQSDQSINRGVRGLQDTPRGPGPDEGRGVPPTPRGDGGDICVACGSADFNGQVCAACGVLPAEADATLRWPAWYREFATRLPAKNVPDWEDVEHDRLAAGWSDAVLKEAAAKYERSYGEQRVSAPSSLFRRIADGVADELARSRSGRGGRGVVRESGGASEAVPAASEPVPVDPAVCTCEEIAVATAPPDPDAQGKWAACLELLRQELPAPTFETWLEGSEGLRYQADDLVVRVPSVFTVVWLEQRMYQSILRCVRNCCSPTCDVHFESPSTLSCKLHGPVEPVEPS